MGTTDLGLIKEATFSLKDGNLYKNIMTHIPSNSELLGLFMEANNKVRITYKERSSARASLGEQL